MDFICIDVGTSGCKAAILTETGIVLQCAKRNYSLQHAQPGWASLCLPALWDAICGALQEIAPMASKARTLMVSSLGETMAMLDADDRLVFDEGMTYLDARNVQMWNEIVDSVDPEALCRKTGKRILQIGAMNQYRWWQRHEPRKMERVKRILFVDSFVTYMLSGEAMMDYSTASNSVLLDLQQHAWSPELAEQFGMDLRQFPKVGRAGTPVGKILPEMADRLGLPCELTILAGCHDQIAAMVGGGALQPGDAVIGEGSTEALNLLIERDDIDKALRHQMPVEPFLDEERYMIMPSRLTHGTCIKWFASSVPTEPGQNVYDMLNARCPRETSGLTFLPYLSNTYFSDYHKPMGSFIGMDTATDCYQAYRALLEGLSCETRALLTELDEAGIPCNQITATGGATKSEVYMQLKADITQRTIGVLKNPEAGLSGLAMICAVHNGCYANLQEAAEGFKISRWLYQPATDCTAIVNRFNKTKQAILRLYKEL